MTATSFKVSRLFIAYASLAAIFAVLLLQSCKKDDSPKGPHQPQSYSSEVLDKWMTIQLRLMRNATGIANHAFTRHYAYTGIAALESLRPGLHGRNDWSDRWNGLTGLPSSHPSVKYYYPANVNAAVASINKLMFPNASAADKAAIDSLESALNQEFLATQSQAVIDKSVVFGKAVANAVYNWSETDGYKNANNPYTPPVGDGLWEPAAANAVAATPYWGKNRPIVIASTHETTPAAPLPFSKDPASPFYKMAKNVYDVSQNLTPDQMAMAIYWRDVPGATSPGHWLSILQQALRQAGTKLDKAALAYALTGAAMNDGIISCFDTKYHYNLLRPITYIRKVMGHTSWNPYIGTPSHPEYSSSHSVLSGAAAETMQKLFGNIGPFTDHTYDYMGLSPRTYNSFIAIGKEASQSRVYGGIHYQQTVDIGLWQGKKIVENIFKQSQH